MRIDGQTRLAAVVANPIKHSLSPFIHNRTFELTDVNGVYVAWEVAETDLAESLANIRRYDMLGLNVSMPYKEQVLPYLDRLDEKAAWIGAINTVVLEGQELVGYNTDGIGFWRSLEVLYGFSATGQKMLIVGSGSTARAIMYQAVREGLKELVILTKRQYLSSTTEKVQCLAGETGVTVSVLALDDVTSWQDVLQGVTILVNATSCGMDGQTLPLPQTLVFPKDMLVADVIYQPFETPLLALARRQGLPTVNGLGMLLYQAAEAFFLWTGQVMPTETIWQELLAHYPVDK